MRDYQDLVTLRKAAHALDVGLSDFRRLAEKYPELEESAEALHEPILDVVGVLEEWEEDQREAEVHHAE